MRGGARFHRFRVQADWPQTSEADRVPGNGSLGGDQDLAPLGLVGTHLDTSQPAETNSITTDTLLNVQVMEPPFFVLVILYVQ